MTCCKEATDRFSKHNNLVCTRGTLTQSPWHGCPGCTYLGHFIIFVTHPPTHLYNSVLHIASSDVLQLIGVYVIYMWLTTRLVMASIMPWGRLSNDDSFFECFILCSVAISGVCNCKILRRKRVHNILAQRWHCARVRDGYLPVTNIFHSSRPL